MEEQGIYKRKDGSFLAWEKYTPDIIKGPGLIYLHGLLSSHCSKKGQFLKSFAIAHGLPYFSFDFTAHGDSSGRPQDVRISACLKDAIEMLDTFTQGPQIIAGSSMGGWTALLLAQQRPERMAGILGLAAAPDFTQMIWKHLLSDAHHDFLKKGGVLGPSEETRGYCFVLDFFEDAKKHFLLSAKIDYNGPVVLMKGDKDFMVPDSVAFQIKDNFTSKDVMVWTVKGAEHALSRPEDLQKIESALELILKKGIK